MVYVDFLISPHAREDIKEKGKAIKIDDFMQRAPKYMEHPQIHGHQTGDMYGKYVFADFVKVWECSPCCLPHLFLYTSTQEFSLACW